MIITLCTCMCLPRLQGVLTRRRQRQAPGPGAASNRAARPVLGPVYTRDAWHDVTRDMWRATLVTVTVNKSLGTSRHIITPRVPQVGTAALSRGSKHSWLAETFPTCNLQTFFSFSNIRNRDRKHFVVVTLGCSTFGWWVYEEESWSLYL